MKFEGDIAATQRRLAETSDLYRRRVAVLAAAAVEPGEAVLEVGCGGGALLPGFAAAAGEGGRVVGIDISADQVAAAGERCRDYACAEAAVADVNGLPYDDGVFDAIVAIQVIEYLEDTGRALSELRRVCKPTGRLIVLATNWDTMFWNGPEPDLTARVQAAWRHHAPHPNLPANLRALLAGAGFRMTAQTPVPIVNNAYHADAFAYWGARLIAAFVAARGLLDQAAADEWLAGLEAAQASGTFFFSVTPVLTTAVAAG